MARVTVIVNEKPHTVDVPADMPLLWVLRDRLSLTGTKYGCGIGVCGACTVHVDGVAFRSCQVPIGDVGKKRVITIEGLASAALKDAWLAEDVAQCGFCQPGQLMQAAELLGKTPKPEDDAIDAAMNDNLCRCGTYLRIRAAIRRAAEREGLHY